MLTITTQRVTVVQVVLVLIYQQVVAKEQDVLADTQVDVPELDPVET